MKKLVVLAALLVCVATGWTIPLQQAFDQALPGAGYDRIVYLDNEVVYTGGLTLDNGNYCILSAGAVVDLQGSRIIIDNLAVLDICGVVLVQSDSAALKYTNGSDGWVDHCTFAFNYDGLYFWQGSNLKITSNIFSNSGRYGVYCYDTSERWMAYNDAWANSVGDYRRWCPS
jgi:parallel beta-helix repeat protein